jgi:hypothetical protein
MYGYLAYTSRHVTDGNMERMVLVGLVLGKRYSGGMHCAHTCAVLHSYYM